MTQLKLKKTLLCKKFKQPKKTKLTYDCPWCGRRRCGQRPASRWAPDPKTGQVDEEERPWRTCHLSTSRSVPADCTATQRSAAGSSESCVQTVQQVLPTVRAAEARDLKPVSPVPSPINMRLTRHFKTQQQLLYSIVLITYV